MPSHELTIPFLLWVPAMCESCYQGHFSRMVSLHWIIKQRRSVAQPEREIIHIYSMHPTAGIGALISKRLDDTFISHVHTTVAESIRPSCSVYRLGDGWRKLPGQDDNHAIKGPRCCHEPARYSRIDRLSLLTLPIGSSSEPCIRPNPGVSALQYIPSLCSV